MKMDPILTKAVRLARRKNYDGAIKTLENEVNRYYGSFTYSYLLGLSYLYSNIFGVALRYLKLAVEQKMRDPNALLGMAAYYLNRGDTDKAVNLYLEIQTIDESNRTAKRALKIIRKFPGPENISLWIDSGNLHKIFPPFPRVGIQMKNLAIGVLAGMAGIFLILGILYRTGSISLPFGMRFGRRAVPVEISLAREEMDSPVQTEGSYRYVLTRNQVLDDYGEATKLFADYHDEAAKVKLNRILESNASDPVKNKARILVSYMEVPGFNTLKDRFSYNEVIRDPFIYRDCHVIWRGMASNLIVEDTSTSFDFLVGYDTYRTMEGIVQVDYDFAIKVNPEQPVEILGRVIPLSANREPRIRIQGIALNQAGLIDSR